MSFWRQRRWAGLAAWPPRARAAGAPAAGEARRSSGGERGGSEAKRGQRLAGVGFLLLGCWALSAPAHAVTVHSRSGQFVVHSPYGSTPTLAQWIEPTNSTHITLAPDPLAVSCERIRSALYRQLDLADRWRGKIHVWIRPNLSGSGEPGLVSTRFADGWQYTLELPERCEARRVVRMVVQALLTELANRQRGPHLVELPRWLVEGLSARMQGTFGLDLVVAPTLLEARIGNASGRLANTVRHRVGADNLQEIRAWLLGRAPLTFAQLSEPGPGYANGERAETYFFSAELFVWQLQGLPHGRRCLQALVANLPQARNWQTAFLHAFGDHFDRLLDVEKWWTVSVEHLLRGEQPNSWSPAISLDKLGEIVQVHVRIQNRSNGPRRPGVITLQEFLAQADFATQRNHLRACLASLQVLQASAAFGTIPLLRSYATVLEDYLRERGRAGYAGPAKKAPALPPALLLRETTARLDELDRQRARLRAAATPAESASPN